MRIGLFGTCLGDTLAPNATRATATVLERLGHDVVFPRSQICCGQMHANSGYRADALAVARRLVGALDDDELKAVVVPSGSCAAMLRDQLPWLAADAGDARLASAASQLATRVFEFSEFLVRELGVTDVGARFHERVAYHPACHSLRVLRIGNAPRRLLENVRGLELVALPDAESCCGFGGLFSIKLPEISGAMLADKISALAATGATVCTSVDNSCLMQIRGGLRRRKFPIRVMHLAEILAMSESHS